MAEITMRRLLKAGAHFGHQTRYWAPKMAPYIFGARNKIHIINLEKTLPMLRQAADYLGVVAAHGGKILFVGTKRQAGKLVREHAIRCGASYVDHRWLGGMLTNYKTVKNSIARLKELEQLFESGGAARLTKKEALQLERERTKLDKTLSGIKDMDGLPAVLFVIDVEQEYIAVAEANKLSIPVVAVVDTNCSPQGIDYIIPGNDDSTRAILIYLEAAVAGITAARAAAVAVASDAQPSEADDRGVARAPAVVKDPATAAQAEQVKQTKEATPEAAKVKIKAKKTVLKATEPAASEASQAAAKMKAEAEQKAGAKAPTGNAKTITLTATETKPKAATKTAAGKASAEAAAPAEVKQTASKVTARKTKAAVAKKAVAKKAVAKKTVAKKVAAKKTVAKKAVAKVASKAKK